MAWLDFRRPKAALVLRQSPDWGNLDHNYLDQTEEFDRLIGRTPGFTRGIIELWDATFDISFFEIRQKLKELTLDNLARVKNAKVHHINDMPSKARFWLFTDDDDWFCPDIVAALRSHAPKTQGITWKSCRFDGSFTMREHDSGFCYTNNYALTDRGGAWRDRVVQHGDANTLFASSEIRTQALPICLSVANKHPCSTVILEKALAETPGPEGLIALVSGFNDRAQRMRLPEEISWARPWAEATVALFAGLQVRQRQFRSD